MLSSPFKFVRKYDEMNSIKSPKSANKSPIQTFEGNLQSCDILICFIFFIPNNNAINIKQNTLLNKVKDCIFLENTYVEEYDVQQQNKDKII